MAVVHTWHYGASETVLDKHSSGNNVGRIALPINSGSSATAPDGAAAAHRGGPLGGGYMAILQQTASANDAVPRVGTTNQHVASLNLDAAVIAQCTTRAGRAAFTEQLVAAITS